MIAGALMRARIAVVFADEVYFERPYCRWEWGLILRPKGTDHVWVTLPEGGASTRLTRLPPQVSYPELECGRSAGVVEGRNWKRTLRRIGELIEEQGPRIFARIELGAGATAAGADSALAEIPQDRGVGLIEEVSRPDSSGGRTGRSICISVLSGSGTCGEAFQRGADGGGAWGGRFWGSAGGLAAEYVHRYAPACFKGGIFWIQCETELEGQFHRGGARSAGPVDAHDQRPCGRTR